MLSIWLKWNQAMRVLQALARVCVAHSPSLTDTQAFLHPNHLWGSPGVRLSVSPDFEHKEFI